MGLLGRESSGKKKVGVDSQMQRKQDMDGRMQMNRNRLVHIIRAGGTNLS